MLCCVSLSVRVICRVINYHPRLPGAIQGFDSFNSKVWVISSKKVEASEVWEFCRTSLSSLEVAAAYLSSIVSVVSVVFVAVVVAVAVVVVDDVVAVGVDASSVPLSEDISVGSSVLSCSPRRS